MEVCSNFKDNTWQRCLNNVNVLYTLNVFQEEWGKVIWMQNTTLPLYVLLERLGFAAAAAAADTVAHFTRSSFESSSVVFLSPH